MVILQIVIKKTTFGRQMLLTGANKKSAFLAGINVNRVKVIAYTVAGFCCGIAAVIYAARFTSASDGAGVGGDFNGAVCSIIGGNAFVTRSVPPHTRVSIRDPDLEFHRDKTDTMDENDQSKYWNPAQTDET